MKNMIKGIGILSLSLLVFSCAGNSGAEEGAVNSEQIDKEQESGMGHEQASHTPGAKIDPVCEMEKADDWTDFVVNNGDTVWFCGEGCKKAYEARPEKYNTPKG